MGILKMMKFRFLRYFTVLVFVIFMNTAVIASPGNEMALKQSLQIRESSLMNLATHWNVTMDYTLRGMSSAHIEARKEVAAETIRDWAAKNKVTDKQLIQRRIQEQQDQTATLLGGLQKTTSRQMDIENSATGIHAVGDIEGMSFTGNKKPFWLRYSQYYMDGVGAIIIESVRSEKTENPITLTDPFVWSTDGHASNFRTPSPNDGLVLSPEELAILTGRNPLNLYGVPWSINESPSGASAHASVEVGVDAPFEVEVTFDSVHGNAPASFSLIKPLPNNKQRTFHLQVEEYKFVNGQWLASRFSLEDLVPGISTRKEEYEFVSSAPQNKPVTLQIPNGRGVQDLRLIGSGSKINLEQVFEATKSITSPLVQYTWDGHLPSIQELEKIREARLKEADPPQKKHNTAWIYAIALLFVSVAWYLIRRRMGDR